MTGSSKRDVPCCFDVFLGLRKETRPTLARVTRQALARSGFWALARSECCLRPSRVPVRSREPGNSPRFRAGDTQTTSPRVVQRSPLHRHPVSRRAARLLPCFTPSRVQAGSFALERRQPADSHLPPLRSVRESLRIRSTSGLETIWVSRCRFTEESVEDPAESRP